MITDHNVTHVVYELVRRHAGIKAAHAWGGYYSITYLLCSAHNVSITPVEVGTVKKMWTGPGNANKARMIDEARHCGYDPSGDHEVDALAIPHTAAENRFSAPAMPHNAAHTPSHTSCTLSMTPQKLGGPECPNGSHVQTATTTFNTGTAISA